jgi:hypothetical protein
MIFHSAVFLAGIRNHPHKRPSKRSKKKLILIIIILNHRINKKYTKSLT